MIKTEELIILVIFVFGYLSYFFSDKSKLVNFLAKKLGDTVARPVYKLYVHKSIGFLLLGAVPFLLTMLLYDKVHLYGLNMPNGDNVLLWSLVPILFFLLVCLLHHWMSHYFLL